MLSSPWQEAQTVEPASVSEGASLIFETLPAGAARPRRRPREETLLRVIAGTVTVQTDDELQTLGSSDEAIIPAGTEHRLSSLSAEARVIIGFRRSSR